MRVADMFTQQQTHWSIYGWPILNGYWSNLITINLRSIFFFLRSIKMRSRSCDKWLVLIKLKLIYHECSTGIWLGKSCEVDEQMYHRKLRWRNRDCMYTTRKKADIWWNLRTQSQNFDIVKVAAFQVYHSRIKRHVATHMLWMSLLKAVTPTIKPATKLQSCSTYLLEIEVKDS